MKQSGTPPRILGYFFVFFLGLSGLSPLTTHAAEPNPNAVGLQVGQLWPSGNIGNNTDGAVAPGIFYEYSASDVFALYANAMDSNHDDGRLKLLSTNVGIKANLVYYDKLSPYAEFGMGLFSVHQTVAPANETAKKTVFGLNLGLGADLDLTDRFFVGMLISINNLFAGNVVLPAAGNVEISGRTAGFFIRGGIRF